MRVSFALVAVAVLWCAPRAAWAAPVDPYAWLEGVDDAKALEWVKARNAEAVKALGGGPGFAELQRRILEVLDSDARIPEVTRRGAFLYNFWRDRAHPRGLWRRTTLEEFKKAQPRWTVLVDLDALARAEHENWVWSSARCLRPSYRRCMVRLSRGGADATVAREYDLEARRFVPDGFVLPESKMRMSWKDIDTLFVGTDFGPGSMTHSGYPRLTKLWKRGTPLAAATLVYAGRPDDIAVDADHDASPGLERDFVTRHIDTWHEENFWRRPDGVLVRIDVPLDAELNVHGEWLTVRVRSPWTVAGHTWQPGTLLATRFDAWIHDKGTLVPLFVPTPHVALSEYSWTRHHLLLNELEDVVGRVEVLTPAPSGDWARAPLENAPALSTVTADGADPDIDDEYFLRTVGYLRPATLARGVIGQGAAETLKQAPAFFDAATHEVVRDFATSRDGTRVPYFAIVPRHAPHDGSTPTVIDAYGGFEISLLPEYLPVDGRGWLARGGALVVANIRGGGEYGPAWHQAAMRENRGRAYEDVAAVAQALIDTKLTSPAHLGFSGGSNGGLLAGNLLTGYPGLFHAIVSLVPLLDMRRYTHLGAGASWVAEFGDPDKPADWAFLRRFSPYENVEPGRPYPALLLETSTRDDRVGPVHARKMAAKLLGFGADVTFYENIEGGHGAAADHAQAAFMQALRYEFLWQHLK